MDHQRDYQVIRRGLAKRERIQRENRRWTQTIRDFHPEND